LTTDHGFDQTRKLIFLK